MLDLLKLPNDWILPLAGMFGLIVGSFLNVVIHRLPEPQDEGSIHSTVTHRHDLPMRLIWPPSRCPACGHPIAWFENIPLASYLAQRGRCRHCRAPISARYPLVELIGGGLAILVVFNLGIGVGAGMLYVLAMTLVAASAIDVETGTIPDALTLPALWFALIASSLNIGIDATTAVLGAAAGYLSLAAIDTAYYVIAGRHGIGRGDWKLLAVIGAFLGPQGVLVSLGVAVATGAAVGLAAMLALRAHRQAAIPFGPFLALGGLAAGFAGPSIIEIYWQWMFR
jgi:leader peptidase (prepilin peptidase)/N-methyltransferase